MTPRSRPESSQPEPGEQASEVELLKQTIAKYGAQIAALERRVDTMERQHKRTPNGQQQLLMTVEEYALLVAASQV